MQRPTGSTGPASAEPLRRADGAAESSRPDQDEAATEADLHRLERQFADSQQLAHVGSWERNMSSERAVWSDELCRIFGQPLGYSPTAEDFARLVHPEDREQVAGHLRRARTGPPSEARYRIVRPDGAVRHVQGRVHGRLGPDGELTYSFGTIQDVSEQHQAQQRGQEAEDVFETAFSHAPIGMALLAPDGRWLKVNAAACAITGRTEAELLACSYREVAHPEDRDIDQVQIEMLLAGEISGYQIERRYLTRSGEVVWGLLAVSLVRDAGGAPRHFICQIEDISERKRAQRQLQEAEAEARAERDHATAIISAMGEGYALAVDGEIKAVNDALCVLTGFRASELVGARPPYPFCPPESLDEIERISAEVLASHGGSHEVTLMRADGERFDAEVTAQAARVQNGRPIGFVNTIRDVSVQKRHQRELERLARTDSLTQLANRHVLQEALEREAARRSNGEAQLALVLLDLDMFKQVNDRFGHPAGDSVLIEVARRLERTVRAGEVLARVGGEEFAWLLPACGADEAVAAADRARAAVASRPFGRAGTLTVSAGVGLVPTPCDGDVLYRMADRALYEAKQRGRNCTCCHGGPGARPGGLALVSDSGADGGDPLGLDAIA
jgi:diguanylate cyclase (GGDEF)-like protein/PAS domain S-box-containing protein